MAVTDVADVTDSTELLERSSSEPEGHRPLLTRGSILMMNVGFFGVQYSFGLTQTAVNPLFTLIGATPDELPILNLAGPVTGLLIQPLIGAASDRRWSPRWGRRRPFIISGAILCAIILLLFPFVSALWLGVICLWLLDAGNNTSMEPYRALISDKLPHSQLARGFLTQSMFTGAGAVLANLSLFVFQKLLGGTAGNGVPYWVYTCFWLGAVCILATVLVAMLRTKEIPPTSEELEKLRAAPKGLRHAVNDIASAVREMPESMHKIGLVFCFQWYAMFIYWQFVALSVGESVFHTGPEQPGWEDAISWSGLLNATYNFFTLLTALFLVRFCQRYGGKYVHAVCLGIAAVSLAALSQIGNQWLTLIPMIGLGICWASMVGVPYLMVASMVPRERTGVYMGILNMMIVVPMLVETVTFGWIFKHLLGGKATNAMLLAGVLLALAAVSMLWVNPPHTSEESDFMPLGRHHISIYRNVVVGTDGTDASMYAVDRAHAVAAEADAHVMVVSAYNPGPQPTGEAPVGARREIYGKEAALNALQRAVKHLNSDRVHNISTRMVSGDPVDALLDAAGPDHQSLIVVGNRGLGAAEGHELGSVPSEVVHRSTSDVLIVQVPENAESEYT
jgi:maltose/moltooligosaccharide transporter